MQESKTKLKVFSAAAFLHDFGSDMVYSIWPLFVTDVFGAPKWALGLIDGLGDAVVSLSQGIGGYLSDFFQKRKVFIWLGYLLGGLSRVGYAVAGVWAALVPLRILDRAGKIRNAPRDAIIAEFSTDRTRGRNFGVLRAFDNFGAVCGITASFVLFQYLGIRQVFFLAAFPSLIAVLLIIRFISEGKPQTKLFRGWPSMKDFSKNFYLYLAASAVFALGFFSYSFLLLYAVGAGVAAALVPMLYLLFTVVATICSVPFGRLADRIGRRPMLFLAYGLWAAVCALLVVSQTFVAVIASFVLYGLHKATMEPVQKAFVSELVPSHIKASGLGSFDMIVGLCALPASLLAGLLWDKVDRATPLYFAIGFTFIAAVLLTFVKEQYGRVSSIKGAENVP